MNYYGWSNKASEKRENDKIIRKHIYAKTDCKKNVNLLTLPGKECTFEASLAAGREIRSKTTIYPVEWEQENINEMNTKLGAICNVCPCLEFVPLKEGTTFSRFVRDNRNIDFDIVYADLFGISESTLIAINNLFRYDMMNSYSKLIVTYKLSRWIFEILNPYENMTDEFSKLHKYRSKHAKQSTDGVLAFTCESARKYGRDIECVHKTIYHGDFNAMMVNMIFEVV